MSFSVVKQCRSCDADILWTKTRRGKNMPIDFDKDLLSEFEHAALYKTTVDFDPSRMTSHFDTCPHAEEHRPKRQEKEQHFYEAKTNNDGWS